MNQFKEVDKESIIVLKSIRVNSAQPTSANDILPNYGTTALKILSNNPITSINTTATNITSQPYGNTAGSTIINPTSSTATTNNNNPSSTNIPHENSNNNNIPTSLYMDRKEGKAPVGGVDTAMSRSGSKPYLRSNSSSANSLHEDTRGGLGGAIITKYLGRQQQQDYVACYAYEAQRDDEFDVNVGDRFIVISRDMGWCVVEKDGKQGWVPEGCLQDLDQTEVLSAALPVSAIPSLSSATATTSTAAPNSGNMLPLILAGEGSNGGDNGGGGGDQSALSGSSNSGGNRDTDDDNNSNKVMHGIALYDHNRTSPNELSIRKGDTLIILEKYQDWLLADLADQRGWVPSCYVSLKN